MRSNLKNDTNHVDTAANNNCVATSNPVGDITGDDGTKKGAGGQDGDDERLVRTGESCGFFALDDFDEDLGAGDTVDVSGIIAEEDATERSEGAEKIRFPGYGRFNRCVVRSAGEGAFSSRIGRRLHIDIVDGRCFFLHGGPRGGCLQKSKCESSLSEVRGRSSSRKAQLGCWERTPSTFK